MKTFWFSIIGFMAGIIFALVFWVVIIPVLNRMLQ
jgi:tetrahydromethanopterin S-methyltransferase subunit F